MSIKNIYSIFFLLLTVIPVYGQQAKTDLKTAYDAAIKKTELIPIEESQKKQYEAEVNQAKSAFSPSISTAVSFQLLDAGSFSGITNQISLGVNAVQPVYQGGKLEAALLAAESDKKSKELSQLAGRVEVYSSVAHSYYQVLSFERDINNLKFIIVQTKEIVTELKKRQSVGRTKMSEVLMAQSQQAVQEAELKTLEGSLESARERFAFLTGLDRNTELADIGDKIPEIKDEDYYLGFAQKRPDVESLRASVETANQLVKVETAATLPQISLIGDIYPITIGASKNVYWDLRGSIEFSIFNGNLTDAKISGATGKLRETKLNLQKQIRQAETEIKTAYKAYSSLAGQIKALEGVLIIAQKNYEIQKQDYRNGLVTNLDVLQALNTLQSTKRSLDKTRFLAFSSWTDVFAAIAKIP